MEERIRERYSDLILAEALAAYGINRESIQELDGFESYIYEFQGPDNPGILRISHSIRRTEGMICAELDWINYLHRAGVGVSQPLRSIRGNWVESLEDGRGGFFLTAAFEKADGEMHRGPEWPEGLLWEYGTQIGRMHHLATTYQPANPAWKRPNWDNPLHHQLQAFIPEGEVEIHQLYRETVQQISQLPVQKKAYGLIHQDAHQGNFFVDGDGKITFFDFDDCSYSWFVEDIALALFYAVWGQEDPDRFTENFLKGFLPGYFAAYPLDLKWFREIPLFMKMRELDLYAVIQRSFDIKNLEDPWCIWFMDGRAERLVRGEPYLEFDFAGFDYASYR